MVCARRETVSIVKCATRKCNNIASSGRLCGKCKTAKYRKEHPERAAYLILKENAKRRNKYFDLTFEQFQEFVTRTGYMKKKGIFSDSWHIDRIDESRGYTVDNLQVLTNAQNVRKYLKYSWDEHNRKMMFKTEVYKPMVAVAGVPF